ncbi:hypothetical protein H0H92_010326 [Tricholoma furcatifolium]|nr:hypothetical protein H0H92_010326 [Tricholoma furcatifolium]
MNSQITVEVVLNQRSTSPTSRAKQLKAAAGRFARAFSPNPSPTPRALSRLANVESWPSNATLTNHPSSAEYCVEIPTLHRGQGPTRPNLVRTPYFSAVALLTSKNT